MGSFQIWNDLLSFLSFSYSLAIVIGLLVRVKTPLYRLFVSDRHAAALSRLGIAIPDLVFQSRDSGLALPGSRDPGIPEVPILK